MSGSNGSNGKGKKKAYELYKPPEKKGIEALTVAMVKMSVHLFEGDRLVDAFEKANPQSKASRKSMYDMASKERKAIIERMGGVNEWMTEFGLGPERVYKVLDDALTSTKVIISGGKAAQVPDTQNRLRGVKILADIHGMTQTNINIGGEITVHEDAPDFVAFRQMMIAKIMGSNGSTPLAITDESENDDD